MTHYLIEFRFFGTAKSEIKKLIWEVNKKFHIFPGHKSVPHITLIGPIMTRQAPKLVRDFKALCDSYPIMHFEVEGYGTFEESRVVFINIKPDTNMDNFRWELSKTIQPYCKLKSYDYAREFNYHATISMKLPQYKFEQVKKCIHDKPNPKYKHVLLRATLLKNQRILVEYDFLTRRLLQRREALSRTVLAKTFNELKKYLEKSKLENDGQKVIMEEIPQSKIEEVTIPDMPEDMGFFQKLFKKSRKVFLISDTHFDHSNIIRYCKRPFNSTNEMNNTLLRNWNNTVGKDDIVFFLGDLGYGRNRRSTDYWLSKLKGKIYYVMGNHESPSTLIKFHPKLILNYRGKRFLLIHDPEDTPKDWDGWVIHGHKHNNRPEFPFINKDKKTINVGVELINYKPVLLDDLLKKMV